MAYQLSEGPFLVLPNGQKGPVSWRRQVTLPDSVKRAKPTDLFASSTPRTVSVLEESNVIYPQIVYEGKIYPGFLTCGREKTFSWTSELNQCRMKIASKIKDQNVNLAVASAEFRESATLFLKMSQELYRGYRALKYGHFYASYVRSQSLRNFAEKWIEFQFGLVPLVSDLQGLCDSLALGMRDGLELQVSQTVRGYQTYSRSLTDPIGNGKLEHLEREDFSVRIKARYTIQNSQVHDVARFGFFNVPALAWELVPFSFVVDWMIPVGGWLNTLDALHGVSSLVYIQGTSTRWSGQRTSSNGGATASARSITKARSQTISGLPIGFPTYNPSQSLKKIVTGMALLELIGR